MEKDLNFLKRKLEERIRESDKYDLYADGYMDAIKDLMDDNLGEIGKILIERKLAVLLKRELSNILTAAESNKSDAPMHPNDKVAELYSRMK